MEYRKIEDGVFEVVIPGKRLVITEINERIQELRDKKQAMPDIDNAELLIWAKSIHPHYKEISNINQEIDTLQELKNYLQSL